MVAVLPRTAGARIFPDMRRFTAPASLSCRIATDVAIEEAAVLLRRDLLDIMSRIGLCSGRRGFHTKALGRARLACLACIWYVRTYARSKHSSYKLITLAAS